MKLLVKFPTRSRKDLFFSTFNKFHDLSMTDQVSYLISIDNNDLVMNDPEVLERIKYYPRTSVVIGNSKSKVDAVNRDIAGYDQPWDIIIIAADDTVPCSLGWDEKIIDGMKANYPDTDGVLFFNDGFWGDKLNTQSILGRKYYNRFGYVYHPDYKSLWCDNDFQHVASMLGKQTYFPEVIIKHEHPSFGFGTLDDEIHRLNAIHDDIDKKVFESRKSRLFDIQKRKIKIVHLLMAPFDAPFGEKQNQSIGCFSKLREHVKSYTQQISFPNRTELPVDTCADPFYVREAPAEDGVWLSYGHYGAYMAHRRAVLEEFSEDIDALIVVEGDVVFDISPADMAQRFHLACEFAEKNDGSLITFGHVGYGRGSEASQRDTTVPMGDYTKIDHFICAHCYMITRKEREQIQQKLRDTKWHAWDTWLYWNYDKKVPIFRTKEPLVYEPEGYSMIDLKQKEINVKV